MGGRTDLRPSLIPERNYLYTAWGCSRAEAAHIHADNRLVGQNVVVLDGRDEKRDACGLSLQRRQRPELAEHAVVVSGTLTADMSCMRLMADALVAFAG